MTKFYYYTITAAFLCIAIIACFTTKEISSNIAQAEDFIDAFYSFDKSLLEPKLAKAPDSAGTILFYQGFAQGGNYKFIERQACQPIDSTQVSCSITVEDDLMLALKIDFHVIDTFIITFENESIVKVVNRSNDLPIYKEAQDWAFKNFPDIKSGPCLGFFDGGPTPGACAKKMAAAYEKFSNENANKAKVKASSPNIETFTFSDNGINRGKIYLPPDYNPQKNYPAIFLMDFQEQHYKIVLDEAPTLLDASQSIMGLNPLLITLEQHLKIDVKIENYETYLNSFNELARYVERHYSTTGKHTLVGRGSEGGAAMLSLKNAYRDNNEFTYFIATGLPAYFLIELNALVDHGELASGKTAIKLHYSFEEDYELQANRELIQKINTHDYPWLSLQAEEYPHLTFDMAYKTAFSDGLKSRIQPISA